MTPLLLKILIVIQFFYIYSGLLFSQKIFTHDSIIWYGAFHYYVDSITNGYFPFWDPYILAGSPFYPNIHISGLLDPLVALLLFLIKVLGLSPLTAWIYFCLLRLFVFIIGSYCLFKRITDCRLSASLSAGILLFSVAPVAFRQMGVLDYVFLTPLSLYFLLLFLDNIQNKKRYLYLSCLLIPVGISLNVIIPVFFVFNLLAFLVVLLTLKIVRLEELVKSFFEKRFLVFSLVSSLLIVMMMAPSISLYQEDEMFPSIRIIQKNKGYFKKLMASEVDDSVISDKFTKGLGVYSSYGNVVNLIYPDLWKSYYTKEDFFGQNDLISEDFQYIGIVPFLLCIIGFLYDKSRYRYLALVMLVLVSINMLSFYGVHNRPPNTLQSFFNTIFPFLKAMEVRQNLSTFFLLYLCILLSLGLKMFFNEEGFLALIKEKYRQIIIICTALLLLKIGISVYYLNVVYRSREDLLTLFYIALFAILIYVYSRGQIRQRIFYGSILLFIFTDIFDYNYNLKKIVLQQNWLDPILIESKKKRHGGEDFQYFREPFIVVPNSTEYELIAIVFGDSFDERMLIPAHGPIAFGESMLREKGAMSKGNNHHLFTTKRYYDYLTHVSLENQFILSGVTYPIIRFFPRDKVKWIPEKELLKYLEADKEETIIQYLFVSRKGDSKDAEVSADSRFSNLEQYEDVLWLRKNYVLQFFLDHLNRKGEQFIEMREHKYLETPVYQLKVKYFSPNTLEIEVKNQEEGYLYYSDGWSKYWKAFDGDKEIPIEVANYNFKAVHLEKGEHTVHFVYDPKYYRYSLTAYCTGLLTSVCMVILTYVKFGRKYA